MPTNDERSDVASRLRTAWPNVADTDKIRHHLRVLNEIYVAVGISEQEADAIDLFDRLAELIEPEPERTCRNVSSDENGFTCSECGAHVYGGIYDRSYDYHGTRWYTTENPPKWVYCPDCGAKVVDE